MWLPALIVGFAVGLVAGGLHWYRRGWRDGHEDGIKTARRRASGEAYERQLRVIKGEYLR